MFCNWIEYQIDCQVNTINQAPQDGGELEAYQLILSVTIDEPLNRKDNLYIRVFHFFLEKMLNFISRLHFKSDQSN